MKTSLQTQAWALDLCRKHWRRLAKEEGISGPRAEYLGKVIDACVETNDWLQQNESDIRAFQAAKKGEVA